MELGVINITVRPIFCAMPSNKAATKTNVGDCKERLLSKYTLDETPLQ